MKIFFCLAIVFCFGLFGLSDAECNIEIIASTQAFNLSSPGYPYVRYPSNVDCWWKVSAKNADDNIAVEVLDLQIESSQECVYDRLSFYDGYNRTAPLLGRICGVTKGGFISKGGSMFIEFKSDSSNSGRGFLIRVSEVTKCGGELTATPSYQALSSPGFPNSYFNNLNCEWLITAENENETVEIEVLDSQIEEQSECSYDGVQVYNGNSNASDPDAHLGTFCGRDTPTFQSSQNQLRLVFKTDGSIVDKGFGLYFKSKPVNSCNLTLTANYHPLSWVSPGFPDTYYNDMTCVWTVKSSFRSLPTDILHLTVVSDDLEDSPDCDNDSVTIYSGISAVFPLAKFCGNMTGTYTSYQQQMMAVFKSGSENITGTGFKIQYQLVSSQVTTVSPRVYCRQNNLTAMTSAQYLSSPGYPGNYLSNEQCQWTITARSPGFMVKINVLDSQLEQSTNCQYDYVKVYDGRTVTPNVLQVWCGDMRPVIQSTGRAVTLVFHSDSSNNYRGFNLSYTETSEPYTCGGSLQASSSGAILTSPGYPGFYKSNLNCVWTITADAGTNIKVDILDSDIETSSSCRYDYVEVDDGPTSSYSTLGKFCGSNTPTFVSSGSSVTITFRTDSSNYGTGFRLRYTSGTFSVCGEQDLYASFTSFDYLKSPNYPYNYPNNADCTWRLDSQDSDYVVAIDVISSDVEQSSGCFSDYLEAFDGYDDNADSLGRWCGTSSPSKHSTGRYLFLKFVSDSSNTGTGFKISYTANLSDMYDYTNVGAIAGGAVGGTFFIAVVIFTIAMLARRKPMRPVVTTVGNNRAPGNSNVYTVSQGPYETTVTPAAFQPPPPYTQVVTAEQSRPVGSAAPPPSYQPPGNSSETTPILSQQQPNQQQ